MVKYLSSYKQYNDIDSIICVIIHNLNDIRKLFKICIWMFYQDDTNRKLIHKARIEYSIQCYCPLKFSDKRDFGAGLTHSANISL